MSGFWQRGPGQRVHLVDSPFYGTVVTTGFRDGWEYLVQWDDGDRSWHAAEDLIPVFHTEE